MATFDGSVGNVHYEKWGPTGDASSIVVFVHGYAEYAARYAHVAERLIAEGAVVYGEDHVGHGHSDGCLLYTSPSPRDATLSRMPSSA